MSTSQPQVGGLGLSGVYPDTDNTAGGVSEPVYLSTGGCKACVSQGGQLCITVSC